MPGDEPPKRQQAQVRALVADLTRTQATLQARSEQLQAILGSRWYRLGRFLWRLRRGRLFRNASPPRMAREASFAQPLDEETAIRDRLEGAPGSPAYGVEAPHEAPFSGERERLLVAAHSQSFFGWIGARAARGGVLVREDRWRTHADHDEGASAAALGWADVICCEWCLGNAVWYSHNKRPGQRLIVRFHRMELETAYPGEVDLERVDAMVFVAGHVREQACERFGWDEGDPRFHVLPNGIDPGLLRRSKLPDAERTLGMIGYVPRLKRLDRALDVLEDLRSRDERWRLLIKGREPWEHPWISMSEEDCAYYGGLRERLERSPRLRGAVAREPFGDDIPDFLRRIGWILSTSEAEGHSVALAEAMASGAVPVVIERPGAHNQYEERWVHADTEAAAEAIIATTARGGGAEGATASRYAEHWSRERLWPEWKRLLYPQTP